MLLPYYIAALNIEHAYFEQTRKYESFEGLCFVDTLDMAEHAQGELGFMTAKNSERVNRQKKAPITIVIGNPPYNAGQKNENDRNQNRAYDVVDSRITDWALKQFQDHYNDPLIDKNAIFHYVYGLLHHPGYREKFADNLKRELPRIPFAPAVPEEAGAPARPNLPFSPLSTGFWKFAEVGVSLAALHLDYEKIEPWPLEFQETPGEPLSYRVEDKMRLSKDKMQLKVNPSLTLAGIPPETFDYRLGNRSALEWVIDQYQVSPDKRSGITSDPNRADDEQYIVRLVGQVIRVSVETVKIINALPPAFA